MAQGTGSTIAFGTSGFTADLLTVDGPGLTRDSVETTTMTSSSAKTFEPGDLYDPGELSITMAFEPDEEPPINEAAETITISWGATGNTWSATGFMTNFSPSGVGINSRMEASATLKLSGVVTIS